MGALIPLILPFVPQIATWLLGPSGNETSKAVENVITSVVGSANPADLQAAIKDPEKLMALQVQIAQIAADREKAERQNELDEVKVRIEDTINSRLMLTDLAKSKSPLAWAPAALSGLVLLIFLVVLGFLFLGVKGIDKDYQQLVYVLLGTLAAMVTQVGNFWLGSSKGSVDKQQDLNSAMNQLTNSVPIASLHNLQGGSSVASPFANARPVARAPSGQPATVQPVAARPPMPQGVVTPIVPTATLDVLARTIWGEARGEGQSGMQAVACVIRNRALHPRWWGNDILSVCKQPWQFTCWNANDPNLPKLQAVNVSDPDFVTALSVARAAATGQLIDPTDGADSYYAKGIQPPSWASRAKFTKQIGRHLFFRVELADPEGLPSAPTIAALKPDNAADQQNAQQPAHQAAA